MDIKILPIITFACAQNSYFNYSRASLQTKIPYFMTIACKLAYFAFLRIYIGYKTK